MKRYKTIMLIALLAGMTGCGSLRTLTKPEPEKETEPEPTYNREAMNHIISGAVAELLGQPKNALVEYHQAAEIDTSSPGIFLSLAENYFVLGEIKSSVRLCNRALALDPDNVDALELLALSHEKLKQYKEALSAYQRLRDIRPYDLETLYSLTSLQIINRNFDQALNTYHDMVAKGLDDPEFRLRIGHLFLQSRNFSAANTVYSDVLQSAPENEAAYLALAATAKAQKDTSKAIEWYHRAVQQNSDFDDAKAELRVLYEKKKSWDKAINLYETLVAKDTTDLTDKLQLLQYYFQSGDTLEALSFAQKTLDEHPKSERAFLALASIHKLVENDEKAKEIYEQALQVNTGFLTVRRRLRDLYVKENRYNDAIALYEPLKDADSTFVGARIEISNLLMEKGDTLKAIQQVEDLVSDHGKDWRVPVTLARYYFMIDKNQRAAPYFDQSIELRADLPGLWVLRGLNYLRMDSLGVALQNFETSLKKFPDDPEINYYTGFIYNRKREFSKAIPFLNKAMEIEPENLQTLLTLASAYDELKLYEKAEDLYENVLEKDNETPLILNNYAYHLAVRGIRLEYALELSQKAVQAHPDNAAFLDTMGWIQYQLGEYTHALEYIKKSIAIQDNNAEVYEHLGDVYFKLGDKQKAREAWERAYELDNNRESVVQKLSEVDHN
ncbi:tetratricopeptide repeat protein [candidate division KSB1 bacterium]|nr:tetratricopeptide repeat protein [candidate division KSB1 bacterium]